MYRSNDGFTGVVVAIFAFYLLLVFGVIGFIAWLVVNFVIPAFK